MEINCIVKWYLDASFAVHEDMKSHTGAVLTLGEGVLQAISTKQWTNTRSSTEAELISFDDIVSKVLWMRLFLKDQGYTVLENVVYRDNQAAMKLEIHGKSSSGKRTQHFEIKFFLMNDLIKQKHVKVEYCPTDKMIADYMTKPLMGKKFNDLWKKIMNLETVGQQECVGNLKNEVSEKLTLKMKR
jgi:hypothetical protein